MTTFARRNNAPAKKGKAFVLDVNKDGSLTVQIDQAADGQNIGPTDVDAIIDLQPADAHALTSFLAKQYPVDAAFALMADTDTYRAARNELRHAMSKTPYSAGRDVPHPDAVFDAEDPTELVQEMARWVTAISAAYTAHTARTEQAERELYDLQQQRAAVREFLGLADADGIERRCAALSGPTDPPEGYFER